MLADVGRWSRRPRRRSARRGVGSGKARIRAADCAPPCISSSAQRRLIAVGRVAASPRRRDRGSRRDGSSRSASANAVRGGRADQRRAAHVHVGIARAASSSVSSVSVSNRVTAAGPGRGPPITVSRIEPDRAVGAVDLHDVVSIALERDQRVARTRELGEARAPPRSGRSMTKAAPNTSAPSWRKQLDRAAARCRRSAIRSSTSDHALAWRHRVLVHLHLVDAVFERVVAGRRACAAACPSCGSARSRRKSGARPRRRG